MVRLDLLVMTPLRAMLCLQTHDDGYTMPPAWSKCIAQIHMEEPPCPLMLTCRYSCASPS